MERSNWFESVYQEEVYDFRPPLTVVLSTPFKSLQEAELQLLSKLLHAVNRSLAAVRIVEEPNLDLSGWTDKPAYVIAFQAPPKGIEPYSIMTASGTSIIFSDSLNVLSGDLTAKQKLWASLKAMFPA